MAKVKIYPLEHSWVKENYPLVYNTFKLNPYYEKVASGKGYQHFKQIGMELKARVKEKYDPR